MYILKSCWIYCVWTLFFTTNVVFLKSKMNHKNLYFVNKYMKEVTITWTYICIDLFFTHIKWILNILNINNTMCCTCRYILHSSKSKYAFKSLIVERIGYERCHFHTQELFPRYSHHRKEVDLHLFSILVYTILLYWHFH